MDPLTRIDGRRDVSKMFGIIEKLNLVVSDPPSANPDAQLVPLTSTSSSHAHSEEDPTHFGEPVDTFTFFPKPPVELRLKIWHFGFPRGGEVNFAALRNNAPIEREITRMAVDSPPPVTLSVNRESRHETLKHYAVVMRSECPASTGSYGSKKQKPLCYNWKQKQKSGPDPCQRHESFPKPGFPPRCG